MSDINLDTLINLVKLAKEKDITLVAVSKTKPIDLIQQAYDAGIRDFGENKVQEIKSKAEQLPKDIRWHLIGHLQTNKVKYIAPFVHLIQSVDSLNLAYEINKQGQKQNRVIPILLQMFIAAETNKFGFSEEELLDHLDIDAFEGLKNISICGLMGMATFTPNKILIKTEFSGLKTFYDKLKANYFINDANFNTLSMGMSGDYDIAIEEGSNLIRVGSAIFGERDYSKKAIK
jgi:hypothetical protein